MLRRKRRLHKWMAIMLSVLLLAGQSDAFVRAEEGVGDEPQTEISSEEGGTDTTDPDKTTGGDNTENPDNTTGGDNTENPDNTAGGDNAGNADNGLDQGDNNGDEDNKDTGDQQGAGDPQEQCTCEAKCKKDAVKTDCPVCVANYEACAGKDDTGAVPGADDKNTGDNTEGGEPQDQCICETACTEEALNADCPVCAAGVTQCAKNVGGGVNPAEEVEITEEIPPVQSVSENGDDLAAEPAMLADEGVEASRAREFEVNNVKYIIGFGGASVTVQDKDQISGEITILDKVHDGTMPYSVTQIGEGAFAGCSGLQKINIPEGIEVIGKKAFYGCSGLEKIEIPNSVKEIWSNAFEGCTSLRSVKLPDGLKSIHYQVFKSCEELCDIEIPTSVTNIYQEAFFGCTSLGTILDSEGNITGLQEIKIPNSVTAIYDGAFWDCTGLTSITLPDNIQQIFPLVFSGCSNLSDVKIPDGVGQGIGAYAFSNCDSLVEIKIPEKVTKIHHDAFSGCDSLQTVELQNGITIIEQCAFQECGSLKSIKLPKSVTDIKGGVFYNCTGLNRLDIVVSSDGEIKPITVGAPVSTGEGLLGTFANLPGDRDIVFWAEDGSRLTGTPLENAINAYIEAGKTDGEPDDGKWYGWSIGRPDTYSVTIDVKKDGVEWVDHGKKYALKEDGDTEFITDLAHVPNGTYSIYDITGIPEDSLSSMARDTGMDTNVDVTVPDAEAPDREVKAIINYYTATFYDGTEAYGTDTPQRPQIILSGKQVAEPTSPSKSGHTFTDWKTQDGGSFNFGEPIGAKTAIYASWQGTDTPVTAYIITASADDEGGSISPSGTVSVNEGDSQTFTITPKEGNRIKAVTVDGIDRTAELMETPTGVRYYTFTNITGNHIIHAAFESDGSNPGGGDNPNPGGGDNPNPGGGGDNPNPGGGDNPNPGGEGDNPSPDGGSTGNVQVTVVSETASPQAENSAVADTGTPQASKGQENAASATGQTAGGKGTASDGKEPKTGDTNYLEVYATLAMIAGLTWLLLCFMDEARGMSEREKEVFVAAFIRWGKKGGAFRKCCAMAAIFCLLAYYHTIGKRVGRNALPENYLGQAS